MTDTEKLINKLKAHDWWYEYTEDRKAFIKGLEERADIYELVCRINGPEVEQILLDHVPEDCQGSFISALFAFNRNVRWMRENI